MTWVRIDDTEPEKWVAAGLSAAACWARVELLAYCNRGLTDGFVRAVVARRVVSADPVEEVLAELVSAGVLVPEGDGYRIADFLTNQPSKARVEKERTLKAERQRRWKENRNREDASRDASGDGAPTRPVPPRNEVEGRDRDGEGETPSPDPVGVGRDRASGVWLAEAADRADVRRGGVPPLRSGTRQPAGGVPLGAVPVPAEFLGSVSAYPDEDLDDEDEGGPSWRVG
ncbi:hypothetical protein [Kineococcus rhizosphaerae]|uniref:Uncharacterized protein n=1 Tax=Kineococcus rhizosphaerae TaxID=559628 RepID=A0A2T0QNA7_9ACTN|nr:hypothetical protein [Kineococcus rhizosphaerae]PRY06089.1 hypothetical protein CLV37_1354 [Kineococcus rhizosphaerae]